MRHYIPEIGARVKLKTWEDYSNRDLPMWAWLRVYRLDSTAPDAYVKVEILNGAESSGEYVYVPLASIDPPIGWQPRYTITCTPDKVDAVLGWMSRGVVVRQSQYIGDGSTAFQPLDNSPQPHWKYGEVTEVIPPEQTDALIRVVKLETEYDVGVPSPCRYCIAGKRTVENNPALLGHDNETCGKCGAIVGFSFDKPYHHSVRNRHENMTNAPASAPCPPARQPAECWVCDGTGIGTTYLSDLSRKDRNAAIAAMHADGWKVTYVKQGGVGWMRERETVVKDWKE